MSKLFNSVLVRYTTLILTICPFTALAQDETVDEISIDDELALLAEEDMVLAAAKHKQKIGFSPSAVIVITRQDIEESGATCFIDLLRLYPAARIDTTLPSHRSIDIRAGNRVLLLLDGREINLEFFPSPFYDAVPVGINEMERIEIVLGPNSALYGANAVAAVISITTRRLRKEFHADLSVSAGQHGATLLEGSAGGGVGDWTFHGYIGMDRENSWADRNWTPKDFIRGTATARLDLGDGDLTFDGGLITGSTVLFSPDLGYMPQKNLLLFHTKAEMECGGLKARAYWYGLRTDLDIDIDLKHEAMGLTLGTIPTLDISGDTFHADIQYDLKLHENDLIIAGLDFRFTNYRCDQLVNPDIREARFGLFLLDERRITRQLHATLGARVDFNTKTNVAISPKLALVYNLVEDHFLRLATGTAFRKPTVIETSGSFKVDADPSFPEVKTLFEEQGLANPNLDNEILSVVEIGYLGAFMDKALRLNANLYFAYEQDLIDLSVDIRFNEFMQIDMENSDLGYDNSGGSRGLLGGGVSIEGELIEALTLFFRGELYQQWEVDEDDNWETSKNQLLASAGGIWRSGWGLTAMLSLVFIGTVKDDLRDPASVLGPFIREEVPARTYLIASINYRLDLGTSRLIMGLYVFNPLGASFRDMLAARAPDGSNFGAEPQGPHALLTARLVY